MLSREDIKKYIIKGDIKIYPFEKKNLTGIGYNLSTTNFAFSINKGILLTVHSKTTSEGVKHYVIIPQNDTVLFFSKEYVGVSNRIAGTFHSKVGRVCQGLGHISTTLDPTWHGQLIISVNNPTSTDIKFDLDGNSGNIFTLLLYEFSTPVLGTNIHDNNSGRCDLLLERFIKPQSGKYHEKHLELKEYIVNEFADSLNGYDDFLNCSDIDEYTKKIVILNTIKSRVEKDRILISEKRYTIGASGSYSPLKNNEEKELLHSCTLYKLIKSAQSNSTPIFSDILEDKAYSVLDLPHVTDVLSEYLRIIDYELEMINHIRRIKWQNKKTLEFAGEKSELVTLRNQIRTKQRNSRIRRTYIKIIITIIVCGCFILHPSVPESAKDAIIAIFSIIMTLLIKARHDILETDKMNKDECDL